MKKIAVAFAAFLLAASAAPAFALSINISDINNQTPAGAPCQPNPAVYPNGVGDPCQNGFYTLPTTVSQSGQTSSGNSTFVNGAQTANASCNLTTPTNFKDLVNNLIIGCIIRPLIPLLIALAGIVFIWGVLRFMGAEDDKGKSEGRRFIIWGLVGLFAMVSVWGLINILQYTFRLDNSSINVKQVSIPSLN